MEATLRPEKQNSPSSWTKHLKMDYRVNPKNCGLLGGPDCQSQNCKHRCCVRVTFQISHLAVAAAATSYEDSLQMRTSNAAISTMAARQEKRSEEDSCV